MEMDERIDGLVGIASPLGEAEEVQGLLDGQIPEAPFMAEAVPQEPMGLQADQMCIRDSIKAVWCVFRLRSGKWVKKIRGVEDLAKDKEVKKRAAANS